MLFEQFKENARLGREFAGTVRDGLRAVPAAWDKAAPERRVIWLVVPAAIIVGAVVEHFSIRWYYVAMGILILGFGSWMLGAMRRRFP
jgi:6-phosphogluconate dehydrogenase (decarboxylating)